MSPSPHATNFADLGPLTTCLVIISANAFAISLKEALKIAYKNNPEINAERENLKVSEEDLEIYFCRLTQCSSVDHLHSLDMPGAARLLYGLAPARNPGAPARGGARLHFHLGFHGGAH